MKTRTYAYIVCSPHPRTGVTTVARLLADFHGHSGRSFTGFDTDPHDSRFALAFPEQVAVADIATIKGQIALFDNLLVADNSPRIVDVWNRSWGRFMDIAAASGFFDEALQRDVTPFFIFAADGSEASIEAAENLRAQWPEIGMAVVSNEGAAPIENGALDHLARYPADHTFEIRALDPVMRRMIEDPGFSFARFLDEPQDQMSIVVRSGLRSWLLPVFQQFQSFEFRLTLSDSQYF